MTRVWKISYRPVLVPRTRASCAGVGTLDVHPTPFPSLKTPSLLPPPPTRPTSSWKAVFVFRGGISRQFAFDRRLGLKSLGDKKTFRWWLDFCRLEWAAASGSTESQIYTKIEDRRESYIGDERTREIHIDKKNKNNIRG